MVFEVPDVFSKNPGPILLKVHILFEEQQWFDICSLASMCVCLKTLEIIVYAIY